jgi:hypothetical protein
MRLFLSSVCPLGFPLTTACSHKAVTPWPFCAKSWPQLRERMLAGMHEAGWQVVGQTKQGQQIWQHRPPLSSSPATASGVSSSGQTSGTEASDGVMGESGEAQHPDQLPACVPGEERDEAARVKRQTRVYTSRAITFTCVQCGREVTEQRLPSHTPLYCSNPACKKEGNRLKARARAEKYRRRQANARKEQQA